LPFISDKFVIFIHEKASPSVKFKGPKTKPTMTNLHRQFAGSELEPNLATFSRNNLKQPERESIPIEDMAMISKSCKK